MVLSDYGVKKRQHVDSDAAQAAAIYAREVLPAALALSTHNHQRSAAEATTSDAPARARAPDAVHAADVP